MGTAANFCIRCGARLPSPAPNYCADCGSQVDAAEKSGFHRLRSRWLLLVLPLSLAAGSVDTLVDGQYLTYLVLVGWTALVLVRKRVSLVRLLGRVPHGFNWVADSAAGSSGHRILPWRRTRGVAPLSKSGA